MRAPFHIAPTRIRPRLGYSSSPEKGAIVLSEIPGWGVKLQTEVDGLQATLEKHMAENRETHKDLYQKVERPSWAVTVVLTIMSGLVGSLAVWALTHA